MSHFDFEIIGIGSKSEIGILSVKARIKLNDDTESDRNEEEYQGTNHTDEKAK